MGLCTNEPDAPNGCLAIPLRADKAGNGVQASAWLPYSDGEPRIDGYAFQFVGQNNVPPPAAVRTHPESQNGGWYRVCVAGCRGLPWRVSLSAKLPLAMSDATTTFLICLGIYVLVCLFAFVYFMVGRTTALDRGNWTWPVIFLWPLLVLWPVHALAGVFIKRKTGKQR